LSFFILFSFLVFFLFPRFSFYLKTKKEKKRKGKKRRKMSDNSLLNFTTSVHSHVILALTGEVVANAVKSKYGPSAIVDGASRVYAIPCKNGKVRCVISFVADAKCWEAVEKLADGGFGEWLVRADTIAELFPSFADYMAPDGPLVY
jgi:hypothetical protein